jgi:hypothetical protein
MRLLAPKDIEKRIPYAQFCYLMEFSPDRARYISDVLRLRKGTRTTMSRGHAQWRKLLSQLPEQFTKRDVEAVGGTWNQVESMRRRGWIRKAGHVTSHAKGGQMSVFERTGFVEAERELEWNEWKELL